MAQGIRPDEQFLAPVVYADIIDLPRWEPGPKHPRMSLYKRAAQFTPFAAVRGDDPGGPAGDRTGGRAV